MLLGKKCQRIISRRMNPTTSTGKVFYNRKKYGIKWKDTKNRVNRGDDGKSME